jgi:hypothetical protein
MWKQRSISASETEARQVSVKSSGKMRWMRVEPCIIQMNAGLMQRRTLSTGMARPLAKKQDEVFVKYTFRLARWRRMDEAKEDWITCSVRLPFFVYFARIRTNVFVPRTLYFVCTFALRRVASAPFPPFPRGPTLASSMPDWIPDTRARSEKFHSTI